MFLHTVSALLAFVSIASATTSLYPAYNLTQLAANKGVTTACIQALNTALSCDAGTFAQLAQPDVYEWYSANMTTLCTSACNSSITAWVSSVGSACAGQSFEQDGNLIDPTFLPATYSYGYNLACLQSSSDGWCLLADQDVQGVNQLMYPPTMCATNTTDYDPPICFSAGFDITAVQPSDMALANLYPKSTLCDDCFVKVFYQRLNNPFLAPGNFTQYLLSQWSAMQTHCSTSIALSTATRTYWKGTVPATASATATATGTSASATCNGQLVPPPSTLQACAQLSTQYGVPDGSIRWATQDGMCAFTAPICLPQPCTLQHVGWANTAPSCAGLQQTYATLSNNFSMAQFMSWNKYILGDCGGVSFSQNVCVSPPGGVYSMPAPVYGPTGTSAYYSTATPAAPTPSGTDAKCGAYYQVASGDTCQTVTLQFGISLAQFQTLNPEIFSNCTNLWLNYDYCVAPVSTPPVSTDDTCGPANNQATCSSSFGACCSNNGTCGNGTPYCGVGNCYSGNCSQPPTQVTPDGTCGPANHGYVCGNSTFGACCSTSGYCGNTAAYCAAGNCYSGNCTTATGGPSSDGTCGPQFAGNKTCTGTHFGKCCSSSGYCGNSTAYCGSGNCYSGACSSS